MGFYSIPFCPPQETLRKPESSKSLTSHPCLSRVGALRHCSYLLHTVFCKYQM